MSRKDELIDAVTSRLSGLSDSPAVASATDSVRSIPILGLRLVNRLENIIDLPESLTPASSTPPRPSSANGGLPYPGYRDRSVAVNRIADTPVEGGDILPVYSRTPQAAAVRRVVPTSLHAYKTKKLRLEIEAPGLGEHIVLLGAGPEERIDISGVLRLNLTSPETISHIKIRVKGLTRTLVLKERRHPVGDEIVFWEESVDLFTESDILPGNESPDPDKLQGVFSFPFSLHLPPKITHTVYNPLNQMNQSSAFNLPPSFVLSGGEDSRGLNEWASCRYYCKVTLGRKGFLKANERLIVPLIFLPRSKEPGGSIQRITALALGETSIPGPISDPRGWSGKKLTHPVKRGVFQGRKASFTVVVLLPNPASFPRLTHIPFHIKITSSDPEITTKFPASHISCFLVQRAEVTAQGLMGLHDIVVANGDVVDDGAAEGESGSGLASWSKRLKGTIKLAPKVGSSFAAPNLKISFLVIFRVACPGVGNTAEIAVPVRIVSSLRSQTIGIPSVPLTGEDDIILPPSYFHVMETT